MKFILSILLSAFLFFGQALAGEQPETKEDGISKKEKLSYSLGYNAGSFMKKNMVNIDPTVYNKAFEDGFAGTKPVMSDKEMGDALTGLKLEMRAKKVEKKKALIGKNKQPASGEAAAAGVSVSDIRVSFKLDTRLTSGIYMGEHWVSPPTFTQVHEGQEIIVEARAEGLDAKGTSVNISPEWIPADPDMVTVSPAQGPQVKITVHRAGQSSVKVTSPGFSRELSIKAVPYMGNALEVKISQ